MHLTYIESLSAPVNTPRHRFVNRDVDHHHARFSRPRTPQGPTPSAAHSASCACLCTAVFHKYYYYYIIIIIKFFVKLKLKKKIHTGSNTMIGNVLG